MSGTSSPSMATSVIVKLKKKKKRKLRKREVEVDPSPVAVVEEEVVTIPDLTPTSCEHRMGDGREGASTHVVLRTVRESFIHDIFAHAKSGQSSLFVIFPFCLLISTAV